MLYQTYFMLYFRHQYYLDLNGQDSHSMSTSFSGGSVTFPGKKKIIITWGCRIEPNAIDLNKFELHMKESFIGGISLIALRIKSISRAIIS